MKQRVLLKGKDGIDLLQRITTLDLRRLLVNQAQPGLILNPQGKILSYFKAKRTEFADQLEMECEKSFLDLLEQYTFGERYTLEVLPPSEEIHDRETELNRIKARIPKLGNEFLCDGESNPLDINLQSAIHDQKGCYPGQEVIEKIIAIGSSPKKLCLVKCLNSKNPHPALPLDFDGGKLTSFEHPLGLAILRKTHARPGVILKSGEFEFEVLES